jgi:hypothetical protein
MWTFWHIRDQVHPAQFAPSRAEHAEGHAHRSWDDTLARDVAGSGRSWWPEASEDSRGSDAHTLMCIRAVIYRLGAINGTAEMRALSLQLQALAFRAEK